MLKAIFPRRPEDPPVDWELPTMGHCKLRSNQTVSSACALLKSNSDASGDGYNRAWVGSGHHRLGATIYLEDVAEKGGCFTYWKGGHQRVHRYFQRHPSEVDGRFMASREFRERGWNVVHDEDDEAGPTVGTQHVAKAGDCLLW